MNNFLKKQEEKLVSLINKFFSYMNKQDFIIIAITLHNQINFNTWHLVDFDFIEKFKNKQPLIQLGSIKINANKYPAYTKLTFDEHTNKLILLTPEKEKKLINNNIDFSSFSILAERIHLANYGEIWDVKDKKLNILYKKQLISIKFNDVEYNSINYRSEIFLVKNKLTNEKFLCNYKGQIVMKKN